LTVKHNTVVLPVTVTELLLIVFIRPQNVIYFFNELGSPYL